MLTQGSVWVFSATPVKTAWHISELVPHSGAMCLIDEVLDVEGETLRCALTVRNDGLFNDPDLGGDVPGWVGIEYMAQGVAAHIGVHRRRSGEGPRMGFLLGTRQYDCSVTSFKPGTRLVLSADRLMVSDLGLGTYDCRLEGDGVLATAKIIGFMPDSDAAFWAAVAGKSP